LFVRVSLNTANRLDLHSLFAVSRTDPFPELYKKPPLNKLIAPRPLASLIGHMLIVILIQLFVFFYVQWQPWCVLSVTTPSAHLTSSPD
jgi:hypothetical protein